MPKTVKATLYAPLFIGCEAVNGPKKAKVTRAEGQYAMVIAPLMVIAPSEGDSVPKTVKAMLYAPLRPTPPELFLWHGTSTPNVGYWNIYIL